MEVLTLDEWGRLQIPSPWLRQLGLKENSRLVGEIRDGQLILQPASQEPEVSDEGGILVVTSSATGNLETQIDELRQERVTELSS